MSKDWKLPSETMLSAGERMDDDIIKNITSIHGKDDIIQNQRIEYHKALLQAESDLKEALRLLDRSSQSTTISAMTNFNNERKSFLNKF